MIKKIISTKLDPRPQQESTVRFHKFQRQSMKSEVRTFSENEETKKLY